MSESKSPLVSTKDYTLWTVEELRNEVQRRGMFFEGAKEALVKTLVTDDLKPKDRITSYQAGVVAINTVDEFRAAVSKLQIESATSIRTRPGRTRCWRAIQFALDNAAVARAVHAPDETKLINALRELQSEAVAIKEQPVLDLVTQPGLIISHDR